MVEGQHKKAAEYLARLKVQPEVVEAFKKDGTVYMLDLLNYGKIRKDSQVNKRIVQLERQYNVVVYAAICTQMYFGYTVNFLVVSPYKEDWPLTIKQEDSYGRFRAYAYCWNVEADELSEFGSIGINSVSGTLDRIS